MLQSSSFIIWAWKLRKIQNLICLRHSTTTQEISVFRRLIADMKAELGEGNKKPEILEKLAQYD